MDRELRCPSCEQRFTNPVLLQCGHNLCYPCAASTLHTPTDPELAERLSLVSEADSGVVCHSRPGSYVSSPGSTTGITCARCGRITSVEEVSLLPCNRLLSNLVSRYCQLCSGGMAVVACEQCGVSYCEGCRQKCHPARGPLAEHRLVPVVKGRGLSEQCTRHSSSVTIYCTNCRTAGCEECASDHTEHEVQPVTSVCKTTKQELSDLLHVLSDKAKKATELIQKVHKLIDQVEENSSTFEAKVVAQCDTLIEAIQQQKKLLQKSLQEERERKQRVLKEQINHCKDKIHRTTGLLQFSVEALKESDATAFLLVAQNLIRRVSNADKSFNKEVSLNPCVSPDFDLMLNSDVILENIKTLSLQPIKAPGPPTINVDECIVDNNILTIVWNARIGSVVEGFVLELDDGSNGPFQEVYCGRETVCTVEGLHFDTQYRVKVKAFNQVGTSASSQVVSLQTAPVAWFDIGVAHPDVQVTGSTASSCSYDDRVLMGSVGFSRGVHYWEWTIDKYQADSDPCFGVAKRNVPLDQRIGMNNLSWAMYIDSKRSWYLHCEQHTQRVEGGIRQGSTVGVLLDLEHRGISFFVNGQPHGPTAFVGIGSTDSEPLYPAVSFNHNVAITLHTGLPIPPVDSDSDELP